MNKSLTTHNRRKLEAESVNVIRKKTKVIVEKYAEGVTITESVTITVLPDMAKLRILSFLLIKEIHQIRMITVL